MNRYILVIAVIAAVVLGVAVWQDVVQGEEAAPSTYCMDTDGANDIHTKGATMQYPVAIGTGSYIVLSECHAVSMGIGGSAWSCPIHKSDGSIYHPGFTTWEFKYNFDDALMFRTEPPLTSSTEEGFCGQDQKMSVQALSAVPEQADTPSDVTLTLPSNSNISVGAPGAGQSQSITKPANRVIPPAGGG